MRTETRVDVTLSFRHGHIKIHTDKHKVTEIIFKNCFSFEEEILEFSSTQKMFTMMEAKETSNFRSKSTKERSEFFKLK